MTKAHPPFWRSMQCPVIKTLQTQHKFCQSCKRVRGFVIVEAEAEQQEEDDEENSDKDEKKEERQCTPLSIELVDSSST